MWRQVLNIKCMKNDQNNPIHSFMNTKSIFLLSPQFFDNDHIFFFFFFFLSLQVTYLPKNSSKLNPDICALRLIKHQISPAVIRPWSDQIWYISYLHIERTPCRSLGDTPETAIDRSPSRGALRGCHHREHVLEVVQLRSELLVGLDFRKWATKTSSLTPSQVGDSLCRS